MEPTKEDKSGKSQEELIKTVGVLLLRLQLVENIAKLCCAFTEVNDKEATYENLFSEDKKKRHYTLGILINLLKDITGFMESFIIRLDKFVTDRNIFIHKLWPINDIYTVDNNIPIEKYEYLQKYLGELNEETIFMYKLFLGFHYCIGGAIAKREDKFDQFIKDTLDDDKYENVKIFFSVINPTEVINNPNK
jgi:hypothetical protein